MTEGRRPRAGYLGALSGAAVVSLVVGAAGSVGLMLRAGHPPLFLRALFFGWVLSPFAALAWAFVVSKRRPLFAPVTLHGVTLAVALGSLACYGGMIPMTAGTRPAAIFLVVPLASWLLLAIVALISALAARRRSRRTGSA